MPGDGYGTNTIIGKVTGPDGRFVGNIEVRLQTQSGVAVDVEYTDEQGGFTFRGVSDGVFHVVIDDARYQRANMTAHVSAMIEPIYRVVFSLKDRSDSPKTPAPFAGDSQTVSVQELKKRYPDKAVKEYTRGNEKLARGDLKGAIAAFEKAVALAPEMYPALGNLGNAYLQSGRLPDAESAFEKALKANPDSAESYVNLGHVYFEMHKYSEAAGTLSRAVQRDPNSALAHFFLGMTDIGIGKMRDAEMNLRRALDLNESEVATAHLALANLYLKTQRVPQAQEQLESFLKLRPQDAQANHVRDVLARLKTEGRK
ncbi:MAG: tetratricopeptide repeat protein [Deltaproteobacteria bacterium]